MTWIVLTIILWIFCKDRLWFVILIILIKAEIKDLKWTVRTKHIYY